MTELWTTSSKKGGRLNEVLRLYSHGKNIRHFKDCLIKQARSFSKNRERIARKFYTGSPKVWTTSNPLKKIAQEIPLIKTPWLHCSSGYNEYNNFFWLYFSKIMKKTLKESTSKTHKGETKSSSGWERSPRLW